MHHATASLPSHPRTTPHILYHLLCAPIHRDCCQRERPKVLAAAPAHHTHVQHRLHVHEPRCPVLPNTHASLTPSPIRTAREWPVCDSNELWMLAGGRKYPDGLSDPASLRGYSSTRCSSLLSRSSRKRVPRLFVGEEDRGCLHALYWVAGVKERS